MLDRASEEKKRKRKGYIATISSYQTQTSSRSAQYKWKSRSRFSSSKKLFFLKGFASLFWARNQFRLLCWPERKVPPSPPSSADRTKKNAGGGDSSARFRPGDDEKGLKKKRPQQSFDSQRLLFFFSFCFSASHHVRVTMILYPSSY